MNMCKQINKNHISKHVLQEVEQETVPFLKHPVRGAAHLVAQIHSAPECARSSASLPSGRDSSRVSGLCLLHKMQLGDVTLSVWTGQGLC